MKEVPLSDFGLVTVDEVARRYGVIPRAVQKWIQLLGLLPAVRVGRGNRATFLIPEKALKGFEKPKKGPVAGSKRKGKPKNPGPGTNHTGRRQDLG